MNSHDLSFADAIVLLRGSDKEWMDLIDSALGGVLALGAIGNPSLVALIGPKNELIRVGKTLIDEVKKKRPTFEKRADRTRRLEAAHSLLVLLSFLSALTDVVDATGERLDIDMKDLLQLTTDDPVYPTSSSTFIDNIASTRIPSPSNSDGWKNLETRIIDLYNSLALSAATMLKALALYDRLATDVRDELLDRVRRTVPRTALDTYREDYRRLAAEVTEFHLWTLDHEVTARDRRAQEEHKSLSAGIEAVAKSTGRLEAGLFRLESHLLRTGNSSPRGALQNDLLRVYKEGIRKPILDTVAPDMRSVISPPSVEKSYLTPNYKYVRYDRGQLPSSDEWWDDQDTRTDLTDAMAAYLTSSDAWITPLLVLGLPGAGKSLFTRVISARLPSQDFMPLRIELRGVDSSASIQRQIEQGLESTLHETVEWRVVREEAASLGCIPVVMLDGFDELLQASGASQSNYLELIQNFQENEEARGHPVCVIVTSRTIVADRARIPDGSGIIRLDSFTNSQIEAWATLWNQENRDLFVERGIEELSLTSLLRFDSLARQPILLLMLAIYDAHSNGLADLNNSSTELYEQLLKRFIEREVSRELPTADRDTQQLRVNEEFQRLELVALAAFNRKQLYVHEDELQRDFDALFPRTATEITLHPSRHLARETFGRFFFVHRAEFTEAAQPSAPTVYTAHGRSYEFLHATFGEYLIARCAVRHLEELFATWKQHQGLIMRGSLEVGILFQLFASQPLTDRAQIRTFFEGLIASIGLDRRDELELFFSHLWSRLLEAAPSDALTLYNPARQPFVSRVAVAVANLLLFRLAYTGEFHIAVEGRNSWASMMSLIRSQLSDSSWDSFLSILSVEPQRDRYTVESVKVAVGTASLPEKPLFPRPGIESSSLVRGLSGRGQLRSVLLKEYVATAELGLLEHLLSSPTVSAALDIKIMNLGPQRIREYTLLEPLLILSIDADQVSSETLSEAFDLLWDEFVLQHCDKALVRPWLLAAQRHHTILGPIAVTRMMQYIDYVKELSIDDRIACIDIAARRYAVSSGLTKASEVDNALGVGNESMLLVSRLLATLDLPHILHSSQGARLYNSLNRVGLIEEGTLPEYGSPGNFLEAFDPAAVLGDTGLCNDLLDIARLSFEVRESRVSWSWFWLEDIVDRVAHDMKTRSKLSADNLRFVIRVQAEREVPITQNES